MSIAHSRRQVRRCGRCYEIKGAWPWAASRWFIFPDSHRPDGSGRALVPMGATIGKASRCHSMTLSVMRNVIWFLKSCYLDRAKQCFAVVLIR
jgi:hypothetical protein